MKNSTHKHLHSPEDDLIQTGGLVKALQLLPCDDGAQISLMQALEGQLKSLEQNFYELWKDIATNENE